MSDRRSRPLAAPRSRQGPPWQRGGAAAAANLEMGTPALPLGVVAFPRWSTRRAASAPGELAGTSRYSSGRLWRQDRADASLSISAVPLSSPHTDGLARDR